MYGVCSATIDYYISAIFSFPDGRITTHGARQGLADIEYLNNVVSALGVFDDENEDEDSLSEELVALKALELSLQIYAMNAETEGSIANFQLIWDIVAKKPLDERKDVGDLARSFVDLLTKHENQKSNFIRIIRLLFGSNVKFN
jgi:hypothetical protein